MKILNAICFLFGVLALASNSNAGTLYASTSAGEPGELYIINQATGAVVQDIGPLNDSLNVNYPITGLAFSPVTGVLYGSTGNSVSATSARLVTINPATALVTLLARSTQARLTGVERQRPWLTFPSIHPRELCMESAQ